MKRSKLLTLAALLLAAVMLLGSCGSTRISVGEKTFTSVSSLDDLKGGALEASSAHYGIFSKDGKTYAFSCDTNSVIKSFQDTADTSWSVSFDGFLLKAVKYNITADTKEISVYAPNGDLLLTDSDSSVSTVWSSARDSVILNGVLYRYDADAASAVKVSDIGAMNSIDSFTSLCGKYIYKLTSSSVTVYDLKGMPIAYHSLPSYSVNGKLFPLAGGDILVQYSVRTDQLSEDHDYISYGVKYKLCTYRFNVSGKNTVKLNCKYLLTDVTVPTAENEYAAYVGKVKNHATGYKIENGRIDTSAYALCELSLSDSGRVKDVLSDGGAGTPTPLYGGRYLRENEVTGSTELLNSRFKTVKSITAPVSSTGRYLIINEKIYDVSLKEVFALGDDDEIYAKFDGGAVIVKRYSSDTDYSYILLTLDGQQKTVYTSTQDTGGYTQLRAYERYGYYYILSGGEYVYYNLNGVELMKASGELTPKLVTDGGLILSCLTLDGESYFLFRCEGFEK